MRNIYADNEAELAAWESASHVERAPRRAEEEEEEETAPPPPDSPRRRKFERPSVAGSAGTLPARAYCPHAEQ